MEEKNMEEKNIDINKLGESLKNLTAMDFINAEKACRASGDASSEIVFSSIFRARLAAKALRVPYAEITGLKMGEFATVELKVGNFLMQNLAEEVIQQI